MYTYLILFLYFNLLWVLSDRHTFAKPLYSIRRTLFLLIPKTNSRKLSDLIL
ncbi:hypothetical protein V6Z11_D02G126800 [Gossypium hirsutum]